MSDVRSGRPTPVVPVAGLVIGVVLLIVGQFVLGWVGGTGGDPWDYVQHAVIFVAGLMIGAAMIALSQYSQQRA